MAVTVKRARELALALENASAVPHFDRTAFRTPRRIFATLALDGRDLNFIFDLAQQEQFCARRHARSRPCRAVGGAWARRAAI